VIETVAVVVPANDEEQLIGPCIAAIERARAHVSEQRARADVSEQRARAHVSEHVETYLVLVLDACLDSSRSVAESWLQRPHRIVEVCYANVGEARAHGARCALRHFAGHDPSRIWLATTDADSRVSRHWLADHIAAANSGADALAGTID
jgi:Glycosyl transferase family 2